MKKQLIILALYIFSISIAAIPTQTMAAEPRLTHLDNGICQDSKTGLMWQFGKSKSFKSMKKAVEYSENLALAGHSDWRLPTIDERNGLKNIYNLQQNGDCDLIRLDSSFWTVGTKKGTQPGRLESNDQCGGDYDFVIKKKGYVRAVRP